jgi:hypothetical protein
LLVSQLACHAHIIDDQTYYSKVSVKEVIWNVSPATTAADADKAPVHRQLPEDAASHNDQCEYVSVAATLVHSAVAEVAIEPPDAAANVAA